MLAGLPLLKDLHCYYNYDSLTGNISTLRVLTDTLTTVVISICYSVEGNFMDLADFPHLKLLNLRFTAVTGDIREIRESDFAALESLSLPSGVYGGLGYEFQHISDGPDVINTLHSIKKQRPMLLKNWYAELSKDSPDWYEGCEEDHYDTPPFCILFVQAGPRVGYRWETYAGNPCEVNWLDPEPAKESSDYEQYIEELREIGQQGFYRGFHHPPTEEEYNRLWDWDEW